MTQRDEFSEALALAKEDDVTSEQVGKLALALAPVYGSAIATGTASASVASTSATAASGSTGAAAASTSSTTASVLLGQTLATKAILATLTAAAIGTASWAGLSALQGPAAQAPRAAQSSTAASPRAAPSVEHVQAPGMEPPVEERAMSALPEPPRTARVKAQRARKDAPLEAQLLTQAHAALRSDAARALRLADEHRARFPHGALSEERELLAIQALERLDRPRDAAARRARARRELPRSVALQREPDEAASTP